MSFTYLPGPSPFTSPLLLLIEFRLFSLSLLVSNSSHHLCVACFSGLPWVGLYRSTDCAPAYVLYHRTSPILITLWLHVSFPNQEGPLFFYPLFLYTIFIHISLSTITFSLYFSKFNLSTVYQILYFIHLLNSQTRAFVFLIRSCWIIPLI